jgi:acyl-coenzyme A thioesterase PaaI-like protein
VIREQALRAIALNREPGFHFAGNFAGVVFEGPRVTLPAGPHVVDADGQVNVGLVAMVADMALACGVRAQLDPAVRLATVSLALQLTAEPIVPPLVGTGEFQAFLQAPHSRQGLARARLECAGRVVGFAQGAFMPFEAPAGTPPAPLPGLDRSVPALGDPDAAELEVLRRVEAFEGPDFIGRFLGYEPRRTKAGASATMPNGLHVANRVGHVQGGLLMGLAASTARATLPASWALCAINAFFVSPGQGKALRARSKVVHHGLMTAVVRTEVSGPGNRRVLEATTAHARR